MYLFISNTQNTRTTTIYMHNLTRNQPIPHETTNKDEPTNWQSMGTRRNQKSIHTCKYQYLKHSTSESHRRWQSSVILTSPLFNQRLLKSCSLCTWICVQRGLASERSFRPLRQNKWSPIKQLGCCCRRCDQD